MSTSGNSGTLLAGFRGLIDAVERAPIGPGAALATLAAVISLRNALELIVSTNPAFTGLAAFAHYPLAYLGPFVSLSLVLAAWSRRPPAGIARLMLGAWLLTLLPPLADALLGIHHETPTIGYLRADPVDLPRVFLRFFDPGADFGGTTAGIRIETLAAVLLAAVYVLVRRRGALRALGAAASVYVVSLFWFTLPLLVVVVHRVFFPGAGLEDLIRGEGVLVRPVPEASPDAAASLWLVIVLAGCGAVWRLVERRADPEERWLEPAGAPLRPGLGLFAGLALLSGVQAAFALKFPEDAVITRAPFDLLGTAGALATLGALLAAGSAAARGERVRAAGLGLLGLAGLAALGTPAAMGLAIAVAAPLPVLLLPWRGAARVAAGSAGAALSAFGATYAGAALVGGAETFARLPVVLPACWLVAGLLAGAGAACSRPSWLGPAAWGAAALAPPLLLGAPVLLLVAAPAGLLAALFAAAGSAPALERWQGRRWAGLGAGLAVAGLVAVLVGHDAVRAPLERRYRCVARLEALRAEELSRKGQFESARTRFRRALECDPTYAMAWRGIGLTFLSEHNPPRAVKALEKAARLAPGSGLIVANLASAYLDAGRFDEAVEASERALALDPSELTAWWNRAQALELAGRRDRAIEAWKEYIDHARGRTGLAADLAEARRHLRALRRGSAPSPPRE